MLDQDLEVVRALVRVAGDALAGLLDVRDQMVPGNFDIILGPFLTWFSALCHPV